MTSPLEELLVRLRAQNRGLRERIASSLPGSTFPPPPPASLDEAREGPIKRAVERVAARLREKDLHGALLELNQNTPHRFTAIYRFDDPTAHNIALFDRHHPDVVRGDSVPLAETYCMYVRNPDHFYALEESLHDERVATHPARSTVRSYCGVALTNPDGTVYGSLCHFDFVPHVVPERAFDLLDDVARVLGPELHSVTAGESNPVPPR